MATIGRYSRGVRMTASGTAIDRPTLVSAFTVNAVDKDCIVNLRDGGAGEAIVWRSEADNAASASNQSFNPPLRFFKNVYLEFVQKGAQSSACIAVVEK